MTAGTYSRVGAWCDGRIRKEGETMATPLKKRFIHEASIRGLDADNAEDLWDWFMDELPLHIVGLSEAAERSNVKLRTMYQWSHRGRRGQIPVEFPVLRGYVGGLPWYLYHDDMADWMKRSKKGPWQKKAKADE